MVEQDGQQRQDAAHYKRGKDVGVVKGPRRPRHVAAQGGDDLGRQVELAGDDLIGPHH